MCPARIWHTRADGDTRQGLPAHSQTLPDGRCRPSWRSLLQRDDATLKPKWHVQWMPGSRIVYARIRASPCNLFVVCVYVPRAGRQNHSFTDTLGDLGALLTSVPIQDCTGVIGDFDAKLNDGRQTGRWCIHSRVNQAGEMLAKLMERRRLCAVSPLHQPRRSTTNAMYVQGPALWAIAN